jgi:hypothetical protein
LRLTRTKRKREARRAGVLQSRKNKKTPSPSTAVLFRRSSLFVAVAARWATAVVAAAVAEEVAAHLLLPRS